MRYVHIDTFPSFLPSFLPVLHPSSNLPSLRYITLPSDFLFLIYMPSLLFLFLSLSPFPYPLYLIFVFIKIFIM